MSLLDWALWYAEQQIPVLALREGTKLPATSHGVKDATTDAAELRDLWRRWPRANIGLATGYVFDVLDVDGADGLRSLAALERMHGALPAGPEQVTRSGGTHLLFQPTGLGNRVKFRPGLDTRTRGGYIVAAPSRVEGGSYAWQPNAHPGALDLPLAPEWLVRAMAPPALPQLAPRLVTPSGSPEDRCRRYLVKFGPAVAGAGGDAHTYRAACVAIKDFGLSDRDALDVLREWNRTCQPPWSDADLRKKLNSARRHGRLAQGAKL